MDLNLTADQAAVKELFDDFFGAESTPGLIRSTESLGFSDALWSKLVGTGAPTMAVSAVQGGGGSGLLEATLAAEAAGATLAPVPLVEHLVTLRAMEHAGALERLKDGVVAKHPMTLALHPAESTARLVPGGAVAGAVLVTRGSDLALAIADPPGQSVPNSAGLALADRNVDAAEILMSGSGAVAIHDRAVDEWRLLTAARLLGLTESALALGIAYVCARHQFGVPIGSFQVIQHGLAELAGQLAGARLLVRRAAWRLDSGNADALAVDAPMALSFTAGLARTLTSRVLHYHGGYGVMEEYDIQLHYRRARGWPAQLGDPVFELENLADQLYGPGLAELS
jgi:hypothetical protein